MLQQGRRLAVESFLRLGRDELAPPLGGLVPAQTGNTPEVLIRVNKTRGSGGGFRVGVCSHWWHALCLCMFACVGWRTDGGPAHRWSCSSVGGALRGGTTGALRGIGAPCPGPYGEARPLAEWIEAATRWLVDAMVCLLHKRYIRSAYQQASMQEGLALIKRLFVASGQRQPAAVAGGRSSGHLEARPVSDNLRHCLCGARSENPTNQTRVASACCHQDCDGGRVGGGRGTAQALALAPPPTAAAPAPPPTPSLAARRPTNRRVAVVSRRLQRRSRQLFMATALLQPTRSSTETECNFATSTTPWSEHRQGKNSSSAKAIRGQAPAPPNAPSAARSRPVGACVIVSCTPHTGSGRCQRLAASASTRSWNRIDQLLLNPRKHGNDGDHLLLNRPDTGCQPPLVRCELRDLGPLYCPRRKNGTPIRGRQQELVSRNGASDHTCTFSAASRARIRLSCSAQPTCGEDP